jgi:WD40 repeat protein
VTDFGIAKCLDGAGQTLTGELLGTPSYAAPEQAHGRAGDVGPRADVYSLCAILYELLTGRPPFRGVTRWETLEQVRTQEPVPPSRLQPRTPRDLETICLKGLQKEPARRYATAADLAADLRRFLEGRPILARPRPAWEYLAAWARRQPLVAALSAAVLVLTFTGLATALALWRRAEERRIDAETAQTKLAETVAEKEAARVEAQRLAVRMALDRGLQMCARGETGSGLLWLAHGARLCAPLPADARDDLDWALRANLADWKYEQLPLAAARAQSDHYPVGTSPGGRAVLTKGYDSRSARLWDSQTLEPIGATLRDPDHPQARILSWSFSPDGATLGAVLAEDNAAGSFVFLWSSSTAELVAGPFPFDGRLSDLAVAPGGKILAFCDPPAGPVRLWSAETRRPIGEPLTGGKGAVNRLFFSPDGKLLVGSRFSQVDVWDGATGAVRGRLLPPDGPGAQAVFSPDGKLLVRGVNRLQLYAAATLDPQGPSFQHDAVRVTAFSPDGKLLATGGNDGTVRLWSVASGQQTGPPLQFGQPVASLAFAPDGRTVAAVGQQEVVRLWTVSGQPVAGALPGPSPTIVTFTPDGRHLVTASSEGFRLWPTAPPRRPQAGFQHGSVAAALALGPDGRLAAGDQAGFVHLATVNAAALGRPESIALLGRPLSHGEPVRHLLFSRDGRKLLSGGPTVVRQWSVATGEPDGPPLAHGAKVHVEVVAFDRDGTGVWTSAEETATRALFRHWSLVDGEARGTSVAFEGPGRGAALSPDGTRLLTGARQSAARLWDADTGEPVGGPLAHDRPTFIAGVAFNPDGRLAVTGGLDNTLRIWDARSGAALGDPLPQPLGIEALALSPDGDTVALQLATQEIRLWSLRTRGMIGTPLRAPVGGSFLRGFSTDGRIVVTVSGATAQCWSAATSHPVGPLIRHDAMIKRVAFSPDGRLLATCGNDRTTRVRLSPVALAGGADDLVLWAEVLTGMALDEHDQLRVLPSAEWQARRDRLRAAGGPVPQEP